MKTRFGAERCIDAPALVVYHLLADYRKHHRPGGFLPPAFQQLEIARGGVGAGTEYRFVMTVGGRRRAVSTTVSEPVPGHKLVETGSGIETTFTVEQTVDGAHVRFDTVMDEPGLRGILNRLFAARMLGPIYEDELRLLEDNAKAHPLGEAMTHGPSSRSSNAQAALAPAGPLEQRQAPHHARL